MAPKRKGGKQVPISPSAPKRRHKAGQADPVEPIIDYDRLVDTILRRQSSITSNTTPTTDGSINTLQSILAGEGAHGSSQTAPLNIPTAEPSVTTTTTTTEICPPATSSEVGDTPSIPVVLNTLFGGESATKNDPQPLNFTRNIPLGATIPTKLKQKIWDNTYFDLRLLLPNHQDEDFSVSVERGAINFQHGKFQKFPISINQWTSAFLIFGSIHIQKTPSDALHLFKYMYMIRDMYFTTKNDAWRYYDEEFRKLRQTSPLP
jgi:hypothetical protein